ncbi:hypothetical protein [Paenibacillus agricola]|uniref:Uncharacterized protein n=1 Tax=Paenibacillus agricola TaxID=2716264 RepID=A0ABX0J0Y8_9BACL|nr:hypothetical protein [Paenibacillus agricola]NHN28557.1 hypothetical protein [Paenibacillus agricola]
MKTKSGHSLTEILKEALEAAEILKNDGIEIDYNEGLISISRAPGEILMEINIDEGDFIQVGDFRDIHGQKYKVTRIAQVRVNRNYATMSVLLLKVD